MQTHSDEKTVRLSVKRVDCDKTKKKICQIFIPYERSFSFLRRRMVGGGDPFYLKFWVNWPLLERCWLDIKSHFARRISATKFLYV